MLDAKTCFKLICDRVLALDFTKRVSKIKFDDVIKKTHVNHVTFSTSREDVKKTTEEQQEDPSKYKTRYPEIRGLRYLPSIRTYFGRDPSAAGCIAGLAA